GDGVAAAVPSLFVSVAAAIVTTRAETQSSMGDEVSAQLLLNPRPLFIASGVLALLGVLPGMPHLPFLMLAAGAASIGYLSRRRQWQSVAGEKQRAEEAAQLKASSEQSDSIEQILKLDTLALEVGYGLIPLVSTNNSFLGRTREIRRQIALDLGIVVPPVHVTDNLQLAPREYAILLK